MRIFWLTREPYRHAIMFCALWKNGFGWRRQFVVETSIAIFVCRFGVTELTA